MVPHRVRTVFTGCSSDDSSNDDDDDISRYFH